MGFYIDLGIDNKYYTSTFVEEWGGHEKRGCCIRSPLATKLLHTILFHEDITQLEQKNSSPCVHVIEAYTEFQQYPCIIFEDMSIY